MVGSRTPRTWDAVFAVICAVSAGFAFVAGRFGFAALSVVIAAMSAVRFSRHWAATAELRTQTPSDAVARNDSRLPIDTDSASHRSTTGEGVATGAANMRSVVVGGMVFAWAVGMYVMFAVGGRTGVDVGGAIAGIGAVAGSYFLRDPSRR